MSTPSRKPAEPVATWRRVSTDSQDEDNQLADITRHVAGRAYDVVREFVLNDVSASKGEQERQLQEILRDMQAGLYKCVVLAHSSRLDRRPRNQVVGYLLQVDGVGGRFESVREPEFHLRDQLGWFTTIMALSINEQYAKDISDNVRAGLAKIRAGGHLDGTPAWGYESAGDKRSRHMVPTPDGRKYIPEIYHRITDGYSVAAVARWLDSQGVPPPGMSKEYRKNPRQRSPHWWPKTVHGIVTNPAYKGQRRTKGADGSVTVYKCPPLVDAGTWRRAQDALVRRPRRGPAAVAPAMLATAIYCGNPACDAGPGSPMYRTGTAPYLYYRCAGRGADRAGCGNLVDVAAADAAAGHLIMTQWAVPVIHHTLIPGNAGIIEAELEDVQDQLDALSGLRLPEEEEDARRAELRADKRRVAATKVIPDTYGYAEATYTYAEAWAQLPPAERGPWLAEYRFRVTATKAEVIISQTDHKGRVTDSSHPLPAPARPVRRDAGRRRAGRENP